MRRTRVLVVSVLAMVVPVSIAGSASAGDVTPPPPDQQPPPAASAPAAAPPSTVAALVTSSTLPPAPPTTGPASTTTPPTTTGTVAVDTTPPVSTAAATTDSIAPPASSVPPGNTDPVPTTVPIASTPAAPAPPTSTTTPDDRAAPPAAPHGAGAAGPADPPGPAAAPSDTVAVPPDPAGPDVVRPITFPVAGPITYVDDYGNCRDGCRRSHRGNDLIGDRLQPLLAMHDGVIDHLVDHPTAGHGVVIRDVDGWEYRTYHVNNDTPGTDDRGDDGTWRFVDGIVPGARVRAGQLVGWMGDSGNSEGSVPHAHIEIHTPSGEAINPYWSLRHAQHDVNCGITSVDAEPSSMGDSAWLAASWESASLPAGWIPLRLTGGHPGSRHVAARMWISPLGFTPVDAAALRVGDARYDDPEACASPDATGRADTSHPAELDAILAAIRAVESGGDYGAEARTSSASGAYQFIDSSWGGHAGYTRARHAPPAVQDARAAEWVAVILDRNGGDVTAVPVSWYLGHVPVGREWDVVPRGNVITPREYQRRWLATYAELLRQPGAGTPTAGWQPVDTSFLCRTVVIDAGSIDHPQLVLTQAHALVAESTGRAVPAATDACDPSRGQGAATTSTASPAPGQARRDVRR